MFEIVFTLLFAVDTMKEKPIYECVRWGWTGDVYDRKVICYEWKLKDCSLRLHKEICKAEGIKR